MEKPIDLISRFCAAWGNDLGAEDLAAFFTDDAVYHNIPLEPVTGRENIADNIASFIRPGPPGIERIEFRVINIAANGPVVMTERVDVFTLAGKTFDLQGMGPSRSTTARSKPGGTTSTRASSTTKPVRLSSFRVSQYARREMTRRTVGPRRSDSPRTYVRSTRIIGGLSVLVFAGAVVWDFVNDGFWSRHALFTSLVASLIVVAVTVAVLNEVLERRQRQRWSVLAQYALFEFVHTARLVWTGLLELADLAPDGGLDDGALATGSKAVLDTPRLAAAVDEMLANADRREQLHRLIVRLRAHGQEVLGRWADVMVNSGTYAEIVDRHVELYSRLYWWGSVLDESDPLEEHLDRPRLSRLSPATQASGPVEDEWLRDNLVAIAQLAESLDRSSFELAMRIVPPEWWAAQLPDRPSTAENHGT